MSAGDHENRSIPRIGAVLAGKYEVERVLGAGAMGVVVAARHRLLRQTVALKLISGSRETRVTAVARFTREARAIAGLASDHIVRILDFGLLEEGTPFMVMQYLPGRDLASEVRARGGKLPEVEAVDHVIHACAGLAVAHATGIVHRDIKPGNLVLTSRASGEPLVVIVDFGISKILNESQEELSLTVSQTTLGSPLYMSPEQIRDPKTVDARTDIWSLGVVLRFLLTGKPAFTAREASGVLAAVIADEPAPLRADAPDVDPGLEAVVLRCLEKKPAFRYASAAELAQALAPYASEAGAALAGTVGGAKGSSRPGGPATPRDAPGPASPDAGTFASMTRGEGAAPRRKGGAIRLAALGCTAAALGLTVHFWHRPGNEPSTAALRDAAVPFASSTMTADRARSADPPAASAPPGLATAPLSSDQVVDAGLPLLAAAVAPRHPRPPPAPTTSPRASAPARVAGAGRATLADAPSDPLDTAK